MSTKKNAGSVAGQILTFINDDGDVVMMMASGAGVARIFLPKAGVEVANEAVLWMKTRGVERVEMTEKQLGRFPITEKTLAMLTESLREEIAKAGLNRLD